MANDDLKLWLNKDETKEFIGVLFGFIETKQQGWQEEALMKGDTNYAKGQAEALRWAAGLPERILNEASQESTGADT